jgi:hypothetical protein
LIEILDFLKCNFTIISFSFKTFAMVFGSIFAPTNACHMSNAPKI